MGRLDDCFSCKQKKKRTPVRRLHLHTEAKYYGADLGEMAGHGLAGTQSQAVLGYLGQVVQQAETHIGYVQLAGHTVLQIVSAAGKLAERKGDGEMTDDVIMSKTYFGIWQTCK